MSIDRLMVPTYAGLWPAVLQDLLKNTSAFRCIHNPSQGEYIVDLDQAWNMP